MVQYTAVIQKFANQGDKTGWTYIEIPKEVAQQINPNVKVSFRVKGKLDQHEIQKVSLLPIGGGRFLLPLNAGIRKGINRNIGETLNVLLEKDLTQTEISSDLMACFEDAPEALAFFLQLPKSHQSYFSNWIESAKTENTKAKRIHQAIVGCGMRMGYGEMIRWFREQDKKLLG